jgi:hypothetical protein
MTDTAAIGDASIQPAKERPRAPAKQHTAWTALESLPALTKRRLIACYAALAALVADRQRGAA